MRTSGRIHHWPDLICDQRPFTIDLYMYMYVVRKPWIHACRQSVDYPAQTVDQRFARTIHGLSQAQTNMVCGKSEGIRYSHLGLGLILYSGKFSNRFYFCIIWTTNNQTKIKHIRKFPTWLKGSPRLPRSLWHINSSPTEASNSHWYTW